MDIGTNSVRLLVADIERRDEGFSLSTLHRLMSITRLGEGVDEEGRLRPSAVERTLDVLRDYRRLMDEEGVEDLQVAATSAVREAGNAGLFRRRVEEITGKEPRVLSGEEEARLSFLGATYDLGGLRPRSGPVLVADIGGGSTEVILGEGEEIREVFSVDVGCVRMSERFLRSDPPTHEERERMERFLEKALSPVVEKVKGYGPALMIGLAGTVTTLSGIKLGLPAYDGEAIHHSWLTSREVEGLYERLLALPVEERRRFMRLEPGRADVIAGGTAVLLALLRGLGQERLLVSEKDILDGLVIDLCRGRRGA